VRIDGLETQVRALSAQLEQLTQQVRALSSGSRRTEAAPPAATGAVATAGATTKTSAASSAASSPQPSTQAAAQAAGGPEVSRFGSTTVTAGAGDPIRGLIDNDVPPPDVAAAQPPASGAQIAAGGAPAATAAPAGITPGVTGATAGSETLAAAPPAFMPPQRPHGTSDNPKQLYETAYGYLMQRDYASAQTAFEEFLTRYPKDSLAGNAEYWLGEAHFVRGDYKAAAGAFLKGYKEYGSNPRAADSLLKLAMSLDRLGQTDAACSSFNELSTRFPDAPDNVKSRAKTERARIGCR
jgi:tol-pal system protein YbgF